MSRTANTKANRRTSTRTASVSRHHTGAASATEMTAARTTNNGASRSIPSTLASVCSVASPALATGAAPSPECGSSDVPSECVSVVGVDSVCVSPLRSIDTPTTNSAADASKPMTSSGFQRASSMAHLHEIGRDARPLHGCDQAVSGGGPRTERATVCSERRRGARRRDSIGRQTSRRRGGGDQRRSAEITHRPTASRLRAAMYASRANGTCRSSPTAMFASCASWMAGPVP